MVGVGFSIFFPESGGSLESLEFRNSKFSGISRTWTSLKRPLFQKTRFSEPDYRDQKSHDSQSRHRILLFFSARKPGNFLQFFGAISLVNRTGIRRLFVTCGVFTRYFFVAFSWFFSWLFRGPLLSRNTVFGPFSWLFRGPRFGQILRVFALEQSSEGRPGEKRQKFHWRKLKTSSGHGASKLQIFVPCQGRTWPDLKCGFSEKRRGRSKNPYPLN